MILENFYHSFLLWVESKLSDKYWLWKLVLFSAALCIFLAFPPYTLLIKHLTGGVKLDAWVFIQNQSQDLFHPKDIGYDVRRENMVFRWMLPLLSFLTGHNVLLIVIIQAILAVLFLYNIGKYIYTISNDKITTAFFILAISNIFVTAWSFADIHGYGDGIAYFFLCLAIVNKNYLVIFVALLAAFFTDERAVIAGVYVALWWMVTKAYEQNDFSFKALVKYAFTQQNMVLWATWIIYLGIRYYVRITYFADHQYSTVGTPVSLEDGQRGGLGSSIWGSFEGTWLLMCAAALILWLQKRYLLLLALFIGFAGCITVGIYVNDVDRAFSYGFPFLLMSLFILLKTSSIASIRIILLFTMVVCVLHPQVFYMGFDKILWLEPFPIKVLMYADVFFGWHVFE